MNIEQAGRLLTLAYFLKTEVKPKEFDMGDYWYSRKYWDESSELSQRKRFIPKLEEHPCGTSACAFGWCSAVFPGRFQLSVAVGECVEFDKHATDFRHPEPLKFFGISEDEADLLFSPEYHRTPKQEAKVIEQLVAKHGYTYA